MTRHHPLPPPDIAPPAAPGLNMVVEDGMATFNARQAGLVIAIGMTVLALLNAQGLWNWASRLPENGLSEMVFAFSQLWLDLMERLKLPDAMSVLRKAFEWLRHA